MASILDALLSGLATNKQLPSSGGLRVADYPNPHGLRAYQKPDGGYGGEMMPKSSGWRGEMPSIAYPGSVSTEISIGDETGEFPAMSKSQNHEQLIRLLSLKNNQKMPKDIYETARRDADDLRRAGKSEFNNPFLDELARLAR